MKEKEKETIISLVEKPLADEGFEVADAVLSRYRDTVALKLFVYGQNGVTVGDCARLSGIVGTIIDRASLFGSGYTLEVSSPGLDRPLTTARDFRYRVGETVRVEFAEKAKQTIRAEILSANGSTVELKSESGNVSVDLAEIERARIVY